MTVPRTELNQVDRRKEYFRLEANWKAFRSYKFKGEVEPWILIGEYDNREFSLSVLRKWRKQFRKDSYRLVKCSPGKPREVINGKRNGEVEI